MINVIKIELKIFLSLNSFCVCVCVYVFCPTTVMATMCAQQK